MGYSLEKEIMVKELLSEYSKRVCEADASWELFCKFPSDTTWKNYMICKEEENRALAKLPENERLKIIQND